MLLHTNLREDYQNQTQYFAEKVITIHSATQYLDTVLTANATPSVVTVSINYTSTSLVDNGRDPGLGASYQAYDQLITREREINGSTTVVHGETMYVYTIAY